MIYTYFTTAFYEVLTWYTLTLPEKEVLTSFETRNYDQLYLNFTWIELNWTERGGRGDNLLGWGLGNKCLNEWNEWIDLLSNEGLFVKICDITWNFEWVMRNECYSQYFENIIKLRTTTFMMLWVKYLIIFDWVRRN